MDRKRVGLVALLSMILTFTFWTAALATPGWMILSTTKSLDESEISGMSIFYGIWCTNGYCQQITYELMYKKNAAKMMYYIDLQVEAVSALVLCMVGLYFVLFNRGSRGKIVVGGNAILVAAVIEFILITRLTVANVVAADTAHRQGVLVEILLPYSLIIAGMGLIFSVIAIILTFCLYSTTPIQTTEGRVLKFPTSSNELTILQEH